jgi:hypothetical protein
VHFIAGAQDAVIRGANEEQLRASMGRRDRSSRHHAHSRRRPLGAAGEGDGDQPAILSFLASLKLGLSD